MLKELGEMGQWSYGFDVEDAEPGTWDGRQVRILKRIRVHEVSPVLRGTSVGTRTEQMRAADPAEIADREFTRWIQQQIPGGGTPGDGNDQCKFVCLTML